MEAKYRMLEAEYATVDAALKAFNAFRRDNDGEWAFFVAHAPTGAVVQVKLFGKNSVQVLRVIRDGQTLKFPSLWDEKVSTINLAIRQALEEAYETR